jgi:imidazolonepropionase-like amidohydrolase
VGTCAIPEGADVLDATGFWVTPGLIDAVVSPDGELPGETEERRERLRFLLGVTTARLAVPRGFTAETSPGAMAWMRGDGTGAGHPVPWRLVHEFSGGLESLAIDGAPPGRVSLTALAAEVASREVMEGRAPPADPRAAGLAARALWLEADETALTESARRLAASGTWLAPLLLSEELWSGPYRLPLGLHRLLQMPLVTLALQDRTLPDRTPEEVHLLEQALDRMRSFVREFSDAGGTVVVGSGGVLAPGLSVHEEMGALVAAGLTPAEAFAAATRSAAIAIGVDDAAGTIRPGLRADLLVLEGDPLADIANAQLVSRIVKGGVLHDPATELDELEGGPTVTLTNARVWIGFFATGVVVFILLIVVRRHAAGLAGG